MKFGKRLEAERERGWEDLYIPYRSVKKQIGRLERERWRIAEEGVGSVWLPLLRAMRRADGFLRKLLDATHDAMDRIDPTRGTHQRPSNMGFSQAIHAWALLCLHLERMERYAHLNALAVGKLAKKWGRRIGPCPASVDPRGMYTHANPAVVGDGNHIKRPMGGKMVRGSDQKPIAVHQQGFQSANEDVQSTHHPKHHQSRDLPAMDVQSQLDLDGSDESDDTSTNTSTTSTTNNCTQNDRQRQRQRQGPKQGQMQMQIQTPATTLAAIHALEIEIAQDLDPRLRGIRADGWWPGASALENAWARIGRIAEALGPRVVGALPLPPRCSVCGAHPRPCIWLPCRHAVCPAPCFRPLACARCGPHPPGAPPRRIDRTLIDAARYLLQSIHPHASAIQSDHDEIVDAKASGNPMLNLDPHRAREEADRITRITRMTHHERDAHALRSDQHPQSQHLSHLAHVQLPKVYILAPIQTATAPIPVVYGHGVDSMDRSDRRRNRALELARELDADLEFRIQLEIGPDKQSQMERLIQAQIQTHARLRPALDPDSAIGTDFVRADGGDLERRKARDFGDRKGNDAVDQHRPGRLGAIQDPSMMHPRHDTWDTAPRKRLLWISWDAVAKDVAKSVAKDVAGNVITASVLMGTLPPPDLIVDTSPMGLGDIRLGMGVEVCMASCSEGVVGTERGWRRKTAAESIVGASSDVDLLSRIAHIWDTVGPARIPPVWSVHWSDGALALDRTADLIQIYRKRQRHFPEEDWLVVVAPRVSLASPLAASPIASESIMQDKQIHNEKEKEKENENEKETKQAKDQSQKRNNCSIQKTQGNSLLDDLPLLPDFHLEDIGSDEIDEDEIVADGIDADLCETLHSASMHPSHNEIDPIPILEPQSVTMALYGDAVLSLPSPKPGHSADLQQIQMAQQTYAQLCRAVSFHIAPPSPFMDPITGEWSFASAFSLSSSHASSSSSAARCTENKPSSFIEMEVFAIEL